MSLSGRFRRQGQRAELRVLSDSCIELQCWSPVAVTVNSGGAPRSQLHCEERLQRGCPASRMSAKEDEITRRRREWVPA
jgi:hypothetical protein